MIKFQNWNGFLFFQLVVVAYLLNLINIVTAMEFGESSRKALAWIPGVVGPGENKYVQSADQQAKKYLNELIEKGRGSAAR